MSLLVNLCSTNTAELKNFLSSFYKRDVDIAEGAGLWFQEYSDPLESADLISAVMDNSDKYHIVMYLQPGHGKLTKITEENYNDIIKGLYIRYYCESSF